MCGELLAYLLSGTDNDSYMCCSSSRVFVDRLETCTLCGYRTDFEFVNEQFSLGKPEFDISTTYDGYYVVSDRCRDLLASLSPQPPRFMAIRANPGYALLFPTRVVGLASRLLRFEKECSLCGQYASITGHVALAEAVDRPLAGGVYRSDFLLGGGNAKSPVVIVSPGIAHEIQRAQLSGAILREIKALSYDEREKLAHQVHDSDLIARLRKAGKPWWRFW